MTNNNLPSHCKPSFPNAQYQTEEATCLKVFASILNVKMLKKELIWEGNYCGQVTWDSLWCTLNDVLNDDFQHSL